LKTALYIRRRWVWGEKTKAGGVRKLSNWQKKDSKSIQAPLAQEGISKKRGGEEVSSLVTFQAENPLVNSVQGQQRPKVRTLYLLMGGGSLENELRSEAGMSHIESRKKCPAKATRGEGRGERMSNNGTIVPECHAYCPVQTDKRRGGSLGRMRQEAVPEGEAHGTISDSFPL